MHKVKELTEWQFRKPDSKSLHKATVPGVVHTDHFDNGLIDDTHYCDNEQK